MRTRSVRGHSIVLAVLLSPAAFAADPLECAGKPATIVGTPADDILTGTNGNDVIVGLGGNDTIDGRGGHDLICGGEGDDVVNGAAGWDYVNAGIGHDRLIGGNGVDFCDGDIGIDDASSCELEINTDLTVGKVSLQAPDGRVLDGALFTPAGYRRQLAVLMTHGANGTFTSSIAGNAGFYFEPYHVTVLSLNRRDFGPTEGGGNTRFPDAVCDLKVGIDYLTSLGYKKVLILGHSKGTQMAAIYPSYYRECPGADASSSLPNDPRVAGVGALGTIADGPEAIRFALFPEPLLSQAIAIAQQRVSLGLGEVPFPFFTQFGFPLVRAPASFLSYYGPDTLAVPEREVRKLTSPLLVLHVDGDNVTPRPWSERVVSSAAAAGVDATLVDIPFDLPEPPPGFAAHGFTGVERETFAAVFEWIVKRSPEARRFAPKSRAPDLPPFDPPLRPNP